MQSNGFLETSFTTVESQLNALWQSAVLAFPTVVLGFVFLLVFLAISRPLSSLIIKPIGLISSSILVNNVVRRSIRLFVMLVGFYLFLNIVGLTQAALAIISGTGVLGIIIGFAFKDIAENFLASLLLSVHKPFRLGDVIEVEGSIGVVDKVTARGTTLIDFDGNHIQFPNATIYKSTIKNYSANPWIRGNFQLGIGYDASIEKSRRLIMEVISNEAFVLTEPEPQVLVESLGSSTINLGIYFWIDGHKHSLVKVASILMRLTLRKLEAHGVAMPDDAREVIFPDGIPLALPSEISQTSPQASPQASRPVTPASHQPKQPQDLTSKELHGENERADDVVNTADEDIESDTGDIIAQAKMSRDPESGSNIL